MIFPLQLLLATPKKYRESCVLSGMVKYVLPRFHCRAVRPQAAIPGTFGTRTRHPAA